MPYCFPGDARNIQYIFCRMDDCEEGAFHFYTELLAAIIQGRLSGNLRVRLFYVLFGFFVRYAGVSFSRDVQVQDGIIIINTGLCGLGQGVAKAANSFFTGIMVTHFLYTPYYILVFLLLEAV